MCRDFLSFSVLRSVVLLGLVLSLSACATYISPRVMTFQNWSDELNTQTWAFERTADDIPSLEHQSYETQIAIALGQRGMIKVQELTKARLAVGFDYSIQSQIIASPQWVNDPFSGGPRMVTVRDNDGQVRTHWIQSFPHAGRVEHVPTTAFSTQLRLWIVDQQTQQRVYESTATLMTHSDQISASMPWLVRGMFTDFPRANANNQVVRLPTR